MTVRYREQENQFGVTANGTGGASTVRTKYLDLQWTHTELLPLHLLAGFRVVLFEGSDPNDASTYLVPPIEVPKTETRVVVPLALTASRTVNAAVQTRYTSGTESSWRLLSGAVAADPDTTPILDGAPGSITPDMLTGQNQLPFEYTFDTWNPDHWKFVSLTAAATELKTTGAHGGKSLECDGNVWVAWKYNIPFDPNKLYKFSIRWRQTVNPASGGKDVYVGFEAVNGSGAVLEQDLSPAATASALNTWYTATVYWRGRSATGVTGTAGSLDPSLPAKAHGDTAYLRPAFVVNHVSGDGVVEVDSVSVEALGWQAGSDSIGTGAINDEKLLVPPASNIIPNGFSEAGASAVGRFPEGQNLSNEPVQARDGVWCRRVDLSGVYQQFAWTRRVPCAVGDQFWAEVWAKGSSAISNGGAFYLYWVNAAGGAVGSPSQVLLTSITTAYRQFVLTGTCPAGAVGFVVYWDTTSSPDGSNSGKTLYLDSAQCRKVVTFDMIRAGDIRTTNYAENGSGYATTGAKMDSAPGGYALKVAANSLLIGQYAMTDLLFRTLQALDGTFATGRTFYRGNNTVGALGGAPNINRMQVWVIGEIVGAGVQISFFRMGFKVQPGAIGSPNAWQTDNLDGMRFLRVSSYVYTYPSGSKTFIDSYDVPITDRLYAVNSGSNPDNNAANQIRGHFLEGFSGEAYVTTPSSGKKAVVFSYQLFNAYGASADGKTDVFANEGESFASTLTSGNWSGGSSAGGGGGSAGGYECVAPETLVLLPDGQECRAVDLRRGMFVWTWHQDSGRPNAYMVTEAKLINGQRRWLLKVADGRTLVATWNHRVLVEGLGWTEMQDLRPGLRIEGHIPGTVHRCEPLDDGPVVHVTIEGAHTFVTAGLLSHNIKVP